jgi:predicted ATPase
MIGLIDAVRFRCLKDVRQPLGGFHVLVGANATGKTTLLDVVTFLGEAVSDGIEAAVSRRTADARDLVWQRRESSFELAIEARLPEDVRGKLAHREHDTVRYELKVQVEPDLQLAAERVLLLSADEPPPRQLDIFPTERAARDSLMARTRAQGVRTIVNKVPGGNDNFYSETYKESGKGWQRAYKLGPRKSALGNLPEDESEFPAATWLKRLLVENVQSFVLNSLAIRRASSPLGRRGFKTDGSNLPWVIAELEEPRNGRTQGGVDRLTSWVAHLRTALPDLERIRTVEREDDRHRYIVLEYKGGLSVPSWMASDGTLRLLALTLPAYLPEFRGVYLIEEPENGLHPLAVETAFQSLSTTYDAQMLLASHSPVVLSLVEPAHVLCFAKTSEGATAIVRGSEHPALRDWKQDPDLGTLFASGVLG